MTHTKGQWRIAGGISTLRILAGEYEVASIHPRRVSEEKANAKLIAAAPELLEALRQISAMDYPTEKNSGPELYRKMQGLAVAAIQKATE